VRKGWKALDRRLKHLFSIASKIKTYKQHNPCTHWMNCDFWCMKNVD